MRVLVKNFFLLGGFLLLSACASVNLGGGSSFELRDYKEVTLENGLRVLYVSDDSLPYVSFRMLIGSGSATDPATQAGLASLTSDLLSKGTREMNAIQISEAFGQYGTEFGSMVSEDFTVLSTTALSFHAPEVFKLYSKVILKPGFDKKEIRDLKNQYIAQSIKRIDSPGYFANVAWQNYLFENHPYAKPSTGTKKSISSIRKKDVNKFYARNYRPNNSILAVVGKIDQSLKKEIEANMGQWKSFDSKKSNFSAFPSIEGRKLRFIHKNGLVQAQIRLGTKGIKRSNEDFLTLRVANTILGGAFSSRLVNKIRAQLGLTYSIYSSFDAREDFGPFEVSTFTKSQTVGKTLEEILKLLEKFHQEGVSEKEISSAKAYLKGLFPRSIETPERLAYNLLVLRYYGISDDYLNDYISNIDKIDVADVNRVIKKYMNPKNMKILVYGDKKASLKQVQALGPVEIKEAGDLL